MIKGEVSVVSKMRREHINPYNYFQTYIGEAERVKLISQEEVGQIQIELVKLLEIQIQRYTRFESTSVKVEKAQELMRGILFALDFKYKNLKQDLEEGVALLKSKSVETLFREGVVLLKEKAKACEGYLQKVKKNALEVNNYAYKDTIKNAFEAFLPYYEAEFNGHIARIDVDYPLCIDDMKLEGAEYVYQYLKKLYYENVYCNYFKQEEIQNILEALHPHQEELLINIFEIVLINHLGRMLVGKDLEGLILSEEDLEALQIRLLNVENLKGLLEEALGQIICHFHIKGFLKHYMESSLPPIINRLESAIKNNSLNQVFIAYKPRKVAEQISFKDGGKMSDEAFKAMIDQVSRCDLVVEKLMVFKEKVHSLVDMVDFLEAECLFGREYIALYKTLSPLEVALLLSTLELKDEESFKSYAKEIQSGNVSPLIWEEEFIKFLSKKEEGVREKLWEVVNRMNV